MTKGASWGSNEELRPPLILSCRKPLAAIRYLLAWHCAVNTTTENSSSVSQPAQEIPAQKHAGMTGEERAGMTREERAGMMREERAGMTREKHAGMTRCYWLC